MDEVVRLLRAQILISNTCLEKLKAIKTTIQAENKGANIAVAVQDMEPALLDLGKLEKKKQEFLAAHKVSSFPVSPFPAVQVPCPAPLLRYLPLCFLPVWLSLLL